MQKFKPAVLHTKGDNLTSRWEVIYFFRHPDTGKLQRFTKYVSHRIKTLSSRRKKGNEIVRLINSRLEEGWNPFEQELRFTKILDALSICLQIRNQGCRKRSLTTFTSSMKLLTEWIKENNFGRMFIDDFNFKHAMDFMDTLKSEKLHTNRTYNNHLGHMRGFFNVLIKREYIVNNPFNKVFRLPEQESPIEPFTDLEIEIIKEYLVVEDPRLWIICQIIFYTFIRPAELVQLRVRDINLQNLTITIPGHVSKNRRQQVVVIPDSLKKVILSMEFQKVPEHYLLFSKNILPGEFQIAPTRLAERFKKHREYLKLHENKKLYCFKHTGVGKALAAGITSLDLMHQCRHSSLEETQNYINKFKPVASEDLRRKFPTL